MYEDYNITRDGKVYNAYGKELGSRDSRGYVLIRLGKNKPTVKRDKMVAQTYLNWFEGCEVHHKNGIKDDDSVDNLECLTPFQHRMKHNRIKIIGRIKNGVIDRVYNSITDAEEDNGLYPRGIWRVLTGKKETCGGYGWTSLEYRDFIPIFAKKENESVSEKDRLQAYALIYNALLSGFENHIAPPNKSQAELQAVFQGFHL